MIERDTPHDPQDWHGTIPDGEVDRFGDFAQQVNRFQKPAAAAAAPATKDCPQCCTAIPLAAKRCPACTSTL